MKKDLAVIFGLFLVVVFLIIFGRGYSSISVFSPPDATRSARQGTTMVKIDNLSVNAEIVSEASDRRDGLSKKDSLPINQGMLFVFEEKGLYPFWMKDMTFPIDIIWIDENKRVVSIAMYASPEPGKDDEDLTLYRPSADSKYVLEVNAGLASSNGVEVGDFAEFGF